MNRQKIIMSAAVLVLLTGTAPTASAATGSGPADRGSTTDDGPGSSDAMGGGPGLLGMSGDGPGLEASGDGPGLLGMSGDGPAPVAPVAELGPVGVPDGFGSLAGADVFQGWAFDTCKTPSVATMDSWGASDYRGVGVYFGGRGRACKEQPNLDRDWMRSVRQLGWRVLPIYVGSQSPCVVAKNKQGVRISGDPAVQGRKEGGDAVDRARALGMLSSSALYLDMEAYSYKEKKCGETTLSFVRAWNREVKDRGYIPGFYSSADSGVRHMELSRKAGVSDLPEAIWFARWKTSPDLYGEKTLAPGAWSPGRRIHQFAGNKRETHGGRTIVIDRNLVHAPVARVG